MNKLFHQYSKAAFSVLLTLLSAIQAQGESTPSYYAGTPKGTFSTTALGGASYSVEIAVPLGIQGLQPQLSVVYNSQAGNGLVGWGCNLTGISAITRVPRDIYHDGSPHGISYDNNDAFALDGNRLVLLQPSEGSDTAVYCLENSPYTRITLYGLSSQHPSDLWFQVKTADGMTREFGRSSGKHTYNKDGVSKVYAWNVSKAEDRSGNIMIYKYQMESNMTIVR
ncbi:MAG: hypothetical protein IJ841_06965 [Prevotella sp.]|nr:hypothetical protein [Prevotella sp.]